jgi:ribosomal protein L37AE/L43A
MEFFTDSDFRTFYGKPSDEISPMEDPIDEYMVGNLECPKCGSDVEGFRCTMGISETGICRECDVQITRHREFVKDDLDYQNVNLIVNEREKYLCPKCKDYHPLSKPVSVEMLELPVIDSERILCTCGKRLDRPESFDTTVDCPDCHRAYTVSVVLKS